MMMMMMMMRRRRRRRFRRPMISGTSQASTMVEASLVADSRPLATPQILLSVCRCICLFPFVFLFVFSLLRYYLIDISSHWDIISGRRVEGLEQRIGNQDNANRCPIQSFHNLEEFLSTFFAIFSFLFNIWWTGTSWSRWWSCSKTSRCRWRNKSRSIDNFVEHIV